MKTTLLVSTLLVMVGCSPSEPAPAAASPKTASAPAPTSATPTPQSEEHPSATKQELSLTWVLGPTKDSGSEAGPERTVDVVVRVGESVKRVSLGAQQGELVPSQQSVCDASLKKSPDVSILHFYTMGPKTLTARRVRPESLEIIFDVAADDEPAKTHGTLATIPIPHDARIVEAVLDESSPGAGAAFDCSRSRTATHSNANKAAYSWTDKVTLSGTIIEKSVASARGGAIKTLFLVPDQPVDLRAGRVDASETAVTGARELWIGNVVDKSGKSAKIPHSLVGKKVTFQGHFEPSTTGHHHSHPWLEGQITPR